MIGCALGNLTRTACHNIFSILGLSIAYLVFVGFRGFVGRTAWSASRCILFGCIFIRVSRLGGVGVIWAKRAFFIWVCLSSSYMDHMSTRDRGRRIA